MTDAAKPASVPAPDAAPTSTPSPSASPMPMPMPMPSPTPPPPPTLTPTATPTVPHLEAKATALLLLMALLVCGAIGYLLYARGAFEATQRLVLVADDSEGVGVGMDLTFSGFPIGRVRHIELGPDGNARILIDVPRKDARWLRTSSVFTLVRGLVGNTNLRAYSGVLADPPLPDNAERRVLAGDATGEIPKLMGAARDLIQNLNGLVAPGAALAGSLGHLQTASERLNGPGGALGLLLGNQADAAKLLLTLDRANALLARVESLAGHADTLAVKADAQVFGPQGLMPETRAAVLQLGALLGDARATLTRVDGVLAEAQAIASNTRNATTDLGALRSEVDASLRKVQQLVNELNRKWPFARDTELRLP